MDHISEKELQQVDLEEAKKLASTLKNRSIELKEERVKEIMQTMETPTLPARELAAKIKIYVDSRLNDEMLYKGFVSDHTRRWVESYSDMLDKLHKNLHGEKSVNINLSSKVSHAQIANLMRKYKKQDNEDVVINVKGEMKDEQSTAGKKE